MKLCTFRVLREGTAKSIASAQDRIGVKVDNSVADLRLAYTRLLWEENRGNPYELASAHIPDSMIKFLEGGEMCMQIAQQVLDFVKGKSGLLAPYGEPVFFQMNEIELQAPVPRPGKIVLVFWNNWNYYKHRSEAHTKFPLLALKASSTVNRPYGTVRIPEGGAHPEMEMAVIIGKTATNVKREDSESYIAGYTIFNDVSSDITSKLEVAMRYQDDPVTGKRVASPFSLGGFRNKNQDTFGPMGPWLTTKDEIINPLNLSMTNKLNGEVLQQGNTSELIFGPKEVIEYVTNFLTLEPGDLVSMGTTTWSTAKEDEYSGERWCLRVFKGVMELEIEGLGKLVNAFIGPG